MQLLKKSAFVGLGLAALSTSTVKRLGNKIVEESKLSEQEGQKLVQDLLEESAKSKELLQKKIEKTVKDSINAIDITTSKDIASINKRLDELSKSIDNISKSLTENEPKTKGSK